MGLKSNMKAKQEMLEVALKNKVIKRLRKVPDLWFFKCSDKFQSGIPDIIGCYKRQMFALELKTAKGKLTRLQEHTLHNLITVGALTAVIRNMDELSEFLELLTNE